MAGKGGDQLGRSRSGAAPEQKQQQPESATRALTAGQVPHKGAAKDQATQTDEASVSAPVAMQITPLQAPDAQQRKRTRELEDEAAKRRRSDLGSQFVYNATVMVEMAPRMQEVIDAHSGDLDWIENLSAAHRISNVYLTVLLVINNNLLQEAEGNLEGLSLANLVERKMTVQHTLSPLCWRIIFDLDILDAPGGRAYTAYIMSRELDIETAVYTLFAMVINGRQYLLLLCKKKTYKAQWGSSAHSTRWFTFVRPNDEIAPRLEQVYSALYAGDIFALQGGGINVSSQERVVTWKEKVTLSIGSTGTCSTWQAVSKTWRMKRHKLKQRLQLR